MATLNSTTLTARLDVLSTRMKLTSVTGRVKNDLALIDTEIILVNRVDTDTKTLEIQRGYGGTQAEEHANGSLVWIDKQDYWLQPAPSGYADESKQIVTPRPALPGKYHVPTLWLPLNGRWVSAPVERTHDYYVIDPRTGSEWQRLRAKAAITSTLDRWVVIDTVGDAEASVANSVGRFGILDKAQADGDFFWAQVGGYHESVDDAAQAFTLAVSLAEACKPDAGARMTIGISGSSIVFGLQITRAPTATVIGAAFLNRPHTIGTSIALT